MVSPAPGPSDGLGPDLERGPRSFQLTLRPEINSLRLQIDMPNDSKLECEVHKCCSGEFRAGGKCRRSNIFQSPTTLNEKSVGLLNKWFSYDFGGFQMRRIGAVLS